MEAYLNDLSTGSSGLSLIDNFDKLHNSPRYKTGKAGIKLKASG